MPETCEFMEFCTQPLHANRRDRENIYVRGMPRPRHFPHHHHPLRRRRPPPPPILGTGPLLGHALLSSWDKPALGTCPLKFLGQARSCDRPFDILGTCPLLEHALLTCWDKPAPVPWP